MRLLSHTAALALLGAHRAQATLSPSIQNRYSFDKDLLNATVTVNFDGYNVTEPYSNSSEATTPWQARLLIRARVSPDEFMDDFDPDDDSYDYYNTHAQINLTYDVHDSGDVEEPDNSWGFCVRTTLLFNVSMDVGESVNPGCDGILGDECLQWLQEFVDTGGPCWNDTDQESTHEKIAKSPCSADYFPMPDEMRAPPHREVPEWIGMSNLTLDMMNVHYESEMFEGEDDTDTYDEALAQIFVLLASWGERNNSDSTMVDTDTVLNGTVLCLRANETAEGSRTFEEAKEDDATVLGRGQPVVFAMAVAAAVFTFVF